MSLPRQFAFWIGTGFALAVVVWILRDMLLPFVAALVLAYLLNPVAQRLETLGLSRGMATVIILVVFLVILVTALVLLVPLLLTQFAAFVRALPGYVVALNDFALTKLREVDDNPVTAYLVQRLSEGRQDVGQVVGQAATWAGTFMTSLWSGGQAIVSMVALLFISPLVALYILLDWPRMVATVDGWLPRQHAETLRALAREIDQVIAAFVRGQASVCLALGIFYAVALTATGLNFGLLIGVVAGVLSFVPYLGAVVGLIVSIGIALVQFWPSWTMLGIVLAIFIVGNILDGYLLQPKLVGPSVGLHPAWLMFALFAFASLLGFVGLLLAVPLAAAIGVVLRFLLKRYQASALYGGPPAGSAS